MVGGVCVCVCVESRVDHTEGNGGTHRGESTAAQGVSFCFSRQLPDTLSIDPKTH